MSSADVLKPLAPPPADGPADVRAQLDGLKRLEDGWLDGSGLAPGAAMLDGLAERFERLYPDALPTPYVYPTEDGGIEAEWSLAPWEISLEVDHAGLTAYWHALDLDTDETVERTLDLTAERDWAWFAAQLEAATEQRSG